MAAGLGTVDGLSGVASTLAESFTAESGPDDPVAWRTTVKGYLVMSLNGWQELTKQAYQMCLQSCNRANSMGFSSSNLGAQHEEEQNCWFFHTNIGSSNTEYQLQYLFVIRSSQLSLF